MKDAVQERSREERSCRVWVEVEWEVEMSNSGNVLTHLTKQFMGSDSFMHAFHGVGFFYACALQGYLAHKEEPPPWTLP